MYDFQLSGAQTMISKHRRSTSNTASFFCVRVLATSGLLCPRFTALTELRKACWWPQAIPGLMKMSSTKSGQMWTRPRQWSLFNQSLLFWVFFYGVFFEAGNSSQCLCQKLILNSSGVNYIISAPLEFVRYTMTVCNQMRWAESWR